MDNYRSTNETESYYKITPFLTIPAFSLDCDGIIFSICRFFLSSIICHCHLNVGRFQTFPGFLRLCLFLFLLLREAFHLIAYISIWEAFLRLRNLKLILKNFVPKNYVFSSNQLKIIECYQIAVFLYLLVDLITRAWTVRNKKEPLVFLKSQSKHRQVMSNKFPKSYSLYL